MGPFVDVCDKKCVGIVIWTGVGLDQRKICPNVCLAGAATDCCSRCDLNVQTRRLHVVMGNGTIVHLQLTS